MDSSGHRPHWQCYSDGIGCVENDAKAAAYFKSASDLGQCRATNFRARELLEGSAGSRSYTKNPELLANV